MAYGHFEPAITAGPGHTAIKILLAGGFGVGKTTMVGAVSEIKPLRTEEPLTERGIRHDNTAGVEGKTTTTVAMDFGRISLREDLVLYLFGTPGQQRFWFMWDEFAVGALGFDGSIMHNPDDIRVALDLDPGFPVVLCDARSKDSAKEVLIALVEYVLMSVEEAPGQPEAAAHG